MPQSSFLSSITALISMVFSLCLVLLIAWLVLRYMSKRGMGGASSAGAIKVLDRVAVGREQSLLLVRAGSKTLLLAFSANSVTTVCEFNSDEQFPETISSIPDFTSVLKKATGGKWRSKDEKEEDKLDES